MQNGKIVEKIRESYQRPITDIFIPWQAIQFLTGKAGLVSPGITPNTSRQISKNQTKDLEKNKFDY